MVGRADLDRLLGAVDARLAAALAPLVAALVAAVRRAGDRPGHPLPPARVPFLRQIAAEGIAALFGATPGAVFAADGAALTPVAALLATATREASALAVAPALGQVRGRLAGHPDLLDALTGGRALPPGGINPRPLVDTARSWVSPDGYRLSDRIWLAGEDIRTRIDTLLDYHVGKGTTATVVADELEQFLTAEGALDRTRRPYGRVGSLRARTLARTETSRAYNVAAAQMAELNPFAQGIGYRLSNNHPEADICDERASADPDGLGPGNYRPRNYPIPPSHPNCRCYTVTIQRQSTEQVIADLGRWARGEQVPGYEGVGTVPLEAETLVSWLTGFGPPGSGR